jgi:hypothetical protein
MRRFWAWYHRHYLAVLVTTAAIFLLQLFHLYWLFTDVVLQRLIGKSYFAFAEVVGLGTLIADYLEVPTLISASLLYINELRRRPNWKSLGYLFLLNTQWAHILWITDEVVIETFAQQSMFQWNAAVAWTAILIDFLEVPVIFDTLYKVWQERHEILARVRARVARVAVRGEFRPGERVVVPAQAWRDGPGDVCSRNETPAESALAPGGINGSGNGAHWNRPIGAEDAETHQSAGTVRGGNAGGHSARSSGRIDDRR